MVIQAQLSSLNQSEFLTSRQHELNEVTVLELIWKHLYVSASFFWSSKKPYNMSSIQTNENP